MRRHTLAGMVCALMAGVVANGQANWITCWWTDQPGNIFIDQPRRWVRLTDPGTFKLDSVSFGMLGVIDRIYTDPNINGTVVVHVSRDPNATGGDPNQPGATQVKEIRNQGQSPISSREIGDCPYL